MLRKKLQNVTVSRVGYHYRESDLVFGWSRAVSVESLGIRWIDFLLPAGMKRKLAGKPE